MLFRCNNIVLGELWKLLVGQFEHGIGKPRDGGHIQWLVKVSNPRTSHWSEGKVTLKQGFDKEIIMRRYSSVNLGRIKTFLGTCLWERWVLRLWSH
jgi:hypothetical protein